MESKQPGQGGSGPAPDAPVLPPEELERAYQQERAARRRAEAALETTEERLRMLLETTDVIPWESDAPTGRFTYVGPQAVRLLGYSLEQWYEADFWAEHIHPDDRRSAIEFCFESSRTQSTYEFAYRMLDAAGAIHWLHDFVSVEYADGEPSTLRGFMIDVTARVTAETALRRSEKRLRLMADSLPVNIAYIDAEQRYQFNNLAYAQWFDTSREAIKGRTLADFLGASTYAVVRDHVERALSGQPASFQMDMCLHGREKRQVHVSYVPHRDDRTGEVLGFYSLVHDVTDRVRAEEEARRHREELAHVARVATMGEMCASLAHEINQPLCAIVSNAQAGQRLVQGDAQDPAVVRDVLLAIAADGKRAGEVIRRIRSLLKKGPLERRFLDINEVIREIATLVIRDAALEDTHLVLDLADALPPVWGDRIQVQQVILNLILNGCEAMADTEPRARELIVRTLVDPAGEPGAPGTPGEPGEPGEPGAVTVSVHDAGVGIDAAAADRLFEPFFTTKPDGMGMGLSISRSIVEAHGGRLWAESNPDRGSTFSFTLPCRRRAVR